MARAVQTAIDSLNFFVESRNAGNIINVLATATGGATSVDLINTDQRGAMFFVTFASVTVTGATLALNFNAKDVQSGTYFPYARVSVDGVSVTASTQYMALFYVGATSTPGSNGTNIGGAAAGNATYVGLPMPGTFQVVSSLTISNTTATMTGTISYSVDYSKVM
jgi:hypothetical protein